MTPRSVQEYAAALRPRYGRSGRREKVRLLDEAERVTGYHRKSLVRLLTRPSRRPRRRSGRPRRYGPEVTTALLRLWEASDRLCSKRLVPFLPALVEALERHGELAVSPALRRDLLAVSPATVDRLLARERRRLGRRPYLHRRAPTRIQQAVPIRTFGDWKNVAPGALQADLVLHCGERVQGSYLVTLIAVDVATGWTELEPALGLGHHRVQQALHHLLARWPVPVRELHTDNGAEFINAPLFGYCQDHRIRFTRGRPYKKNDQAWVEQKNWTAVRAHVGYDRYEGREALLALRRLYVPLGRHINHFQPTRKLVEKRRSGARVQKRYDLARTPCQRLLDTRPGNRREIEERYRTLNPLALRADIERLQRELWKLAAPPSSR
jgi:hypothetical protein